MCAPPARAQRGFVPPETGKLVKLAASLDPQTQLEWSADGKQVAFLRLPGSGAGTQELLIVDAESGANHMVNAPEWVRYLHWTPSGKALILADEHKVAWFDILSGTERLLVSRPESVFDVKISPNGRWVSWIESHNLHVMNVDDGRSHAITVGGTDIFRKGELDPQYAKAFGLMTGYWWAPDSMRIVYLAMNTGGQTYFVPGGALPKIQVLLAELASKEPAREIVAANSKPYVVRVEWLAASKRLVIERLNREQNEIELSIADPVTGQSRGVFTERDQYWINFPNDLYFFSDEKRFLWSSERSGYRHLYLYQADGTLLKQLTHGNWEVHALSGVDESRNALYFTGSFKSPLESHVYRTSLDGADPSPLTVQAQGWHAPTLSPRLDRLLDSHSSVTTPPGVDLLNVDGSLVTHLGAVASEYGTLPEFLAIRLHDGTPLAAMMIKPPDFNAALKYPLIVYTYDGPNGRVVKNAWGGWPLLWHQFMAKKGYVILLVDTRGSAGYGHLFEEPLHFRFGARELADLREVVAYLRRLPYVDPNRLGIWGQGYGGHMVVHAMLEFPDGFKAGFADSPITDWTLSSGYFSEKYLGLLPERVHAYDESNAFDLAWALKGRLLIAANRYDPDVHFDHVLALEKELMKKGKSADVLVFPSADHLKDQGLLTALLERMTSFFSQL